MKPSPLILVAVAIAAVATPALAHHGVAAVSPAGESAAAGPQGPGAGMETTSPLPLGEGTLFTMLRTEFVPYQQFAFADPTNKTFASFNTLVLGYGVTPWLSVYVFQPVEVKAQDSVGTNVGLGDTNFTAALALKWHDGLRLVPDRETVEDLMDWHFSVWASCTIPVGPTAAKDDTGAYYEPEMQTGFGAPSPAVGVAVMKQMTPNWTWIADASHEFFFAHTYPFTRYQFGGETRLNTAAVFRAVASGSFRLDLAAELNGLLVQRDHEVNATGSMEPARATGGAMIYAGVGVRAYIGQFTLGLGVRRAVVKSLNEQSEQQGTEGLEVLRAAVSFGYAARL